MSRTFDARPAVRASVPLLVGLTGPSGSGKTYSALRLATGMQRVTGGEIYVIDTESRRALHYADDFTFQHVEFTEPFSPLDYLAAIEYCTEKGAKILVVDSTSHEHEGPGGVLEWHDAEVERLSKEWKTSKDKVQIAAWNAPKTARRKLLNGVLRLGVNAIFCFRAKEKIKPVTGKQPLHLGWMPIAGDEFLYEQTVNLLLYPASNGVPTWKTQEVGERQMLKLPKQFKHIFEKQQPLSEEIGQQLAEWAAGEPQAPKPEAEPPSDAAADLISAMLAAPDAESLADLANEVKTKDWTDEERNALRAAYTQRSKALSR